MSASCSNTAQNCWDNCCDIYGLCPSSSADCYYYYYSTSTSTGLSTGAIAGIAVGVVIFIVIIALSSYCRRKRIQERMMRQRMMMQNMTPNMMAANMMTPGMVQPMMPINPIGPSYNPMTQQPPMNPLMPNPSCN